MSNDMHPDLKWLAEVCEEWLGSFESLGVQDGEPCWGYSVTSACPYTKPQWLQARQLLGLAPMDGERWSEWIEWVGGECPLPDNAIVEYRMRDGDGEVFRGAGDLRWTCEALETDIIAYRYRLDDNTITEEEAEIPAEEWGAKPDMINAPPHYQLHEGYEVYDLRQDLAQKAMAANVPHDQYSDWDRALEYLLRMWDKNGLEDAKKGRWYMDKLIAKLEASALRAGKGEVVK